MNKKITAISIAILIITLSVTVGNFNPYGETSTNASYGSINTFAAKDTTVQTTQSLNDFVGDKVENATVLGDIVADASDVIGNIGGGLGNLGDLGDLGGALGGIGDALGGLIQDANGGSNSGNGGNNSPTYNVNTETMPQIDMVPAVSGFTMPTQSSSTTVPVVNETVDFAAVKNPYQKPKGEIKGGDTGEGVKWVQWIFIYTRYGLKDNGITGVFDEDTIAVVKKLQKENGLTADGIVNDVVLDKIELLYFEATYSTTVPAITQTTQTPQTMANTEAEGNSNGSGNVLIYILLFILIVFIWIIAFIFIIIYAIIRKKKKKKVLAQNTTADANELVPDTAPQNVSAEQEASAISQDLNQTVDGETETIVITETASNGANEEFPSLKQFPVNNSGFDEDKTEKINDME